VGGWGRSLCCGSGFGIGEKSRSGMNYPDHTSKSSETIFLVFKFFDADPESFYLGPALEKIWIRNEHPGSATLEAAKHRTARILNDQSITITNIPASIQRIHTTSNTNKTPKLIFVNLLME
jgi:hypothetical protein